MMRPTISSMSRRSLISRHSLTIPSIRSNANLSIVGSGSRAFHQTPCHYGLREADRNRDEDLTEDIEQRIKKHNDDRARGDPKWEEALATNSEADVRADRDGFPDSKEVEQVSKARKDREKKMNA